MSKALFGIGCGLIGVAVGAVSSYFITKTVVSKKLDDKWNAAIAEQLMMQGNYYRKILGETAKDKEYSDEEEVKPELEKPDEKIVLTDPKKRASEIAQDMSIVDYHKKFGTATMNMFDDDEDSWDLSSKPLPISETPYCIRRAIYFDEVPEELREHDKVELVLFTGDFIRKADGEKEYLKILWSENTTNDKFDKDGNMILYEEDKDPYFKRVITSAEAAAILGPDWEKNIGDDNWDSSDDYPIGFDYDSDEVCVRNEVLKVDFHITRDDRMFKCVIKGMSPGDDFDYSEVM